MGWALLCCSGVPALVQVTSSRKAQVSQKGELGNSSTLKLGFSPATERNRPLGSPPGERGSSSRSLGLSHCLSLANIQTTSPGVARQDLTSGGVSRLMQIAAWKDAGSHGFLVIHAWGSTHFCCPPLVPPALFGQNFFWAGPKGWLAVLPSTGTRWCPHLPA